MVNTTVSNGLVAMDPTGDPFFEMDSPYSEFRCSSN